VEGSFSSWSNFVDLTAVEPSESVPVEIGWGLGILLEGTRRAVESLIEHLAEAGCFSSLTTSTTWGLRPRRYRIFCRRARHCSW